MRYMSSVASIGSDFTTSVEINYTTATCGIDKMLDVVQLDETDHYRRVSAILSYMKHVPQSRHLQS